MYPNGVIHTHAVKLYLFKPGVDEPETEMYFIPDKQYHDIRAFLKKFNKMECE